MDWQRQILCKCCAAIILSYRLGSQQLELPWWQDKLWDRRCFEMPRTDSRCCSRPFHKMRTLACSGCRCHAPAFQGVNKALKDQASIGAAKDRFTGAFGMRHQAGEVAAFVADARDVPKRAIGIRRVCHFALSVAVMPKDLVVRLEFVQCLVVGEVAAFTMSN